MNKINFCHTLVKFVLLMLGESRQLKCLSKYEFQTDTSNVRKKNFFISFDGFSYFTNCESMRIFCVWSSLVSKELTKYSSKSLQNLTCKRIRDKLLSKFQFQIFHRSEKSFNKGKNNSTSAKLTIKHNPFTTQPLSYPSLRDKTVESSP